MATEAWVKVTIYVPREDDEANPEQLEHLKNQVKSFLWRNLPPGWGIDVDGPELHDTQG